MAIQQYSFCSEEVGNYAPSPPPRLLHLHLWLWFCTAQYALEVSSALNYESNKQSQSLPEVRRPHMQMKQQPFDLL